MTHKDRTPITWNGIIVGYIEELRVDHFHVYGRWRPASGAEHEKFLAAIQSDESVVVRIGDADPAWMGSVEGEPSDEIEILTRP